MTAKVCIGTSVRCWGCLLWFLFLTVTAQAMEFAPYDSFRSYQTPQLQPFGAEPEFQEKPFSSYSPGPAQPDVDMPEYTERPYGQIESPQEPDVQMQEGAFRPYNKFRPLSPIRQGPERPMQPFDFSPFKPLGE